MVVLQDVLLWTSTLKRFSHHLTRRPRTSQFPIYIYIYTHTYIHTLTNKSRSFLFQILLVNGLIYPSEVQILSLTVPRRLHILRPKLESTFSAVSLHVRSNYLFGSWFKEPKRICFCLESQHVDVSPMTCYVYPLLVLKLAMSVGMDDFFFSSPFGPSQLSLF